MRGVMLMPPKLTPMCAANLLGIQIHSNFRVHKIWMRDFPHLDGNANSVT